MFKKALVLGAISLGIVGIATACSTSSGGSGNTGGGSATGGSGGTATGGSGGTATGGSGGTATGGSGGTGPAINLPAGCVNAGALTIGCNPVTNDGCNTGAGEACDLGSDNSGNSALQCFPAPNTQKLGETCSNGQNGPFCEGTLHCDEPQPADGGTAGAGGAGGAGGAAADAGTAGAGGAAATAGSCKHYCCSSSDCNGGTCTPFDTTLGTLGVCN